MLHLPILRAGEPYRSLAVIELPHVRTGEPVAAVSQANPGLISRDLARAGENRRALETRSVAELLEICRGAAKLFAESELVMDPIEGAKQSPADYVAALSATTGMPHALCRANMEKIRFVLAEMETVLAGLTRGLDLTVLDGGAGEQNGRMLSYIATADTLGVVLPSNSPGVHSLWLPAVPLKMTLALKPGRQEPWTPARVLQALLAAGCPREALGFYPTDHAGATEIMMGSGRSMIFGDESTVGAWKHDPRVEIHGPGRSKVLFGTDQADSWEARLDLMLASIADNGGRSCINASGVWIPSHGRAVAEALAQRLARIEALPLDDPAASIAAFPEPRVAHAISDFIDRQLRIDGAEDLTEGLRGGPRLVEVEGCTYLLPTVVWCEDAEHPLARSEFLFPFVSVVQVPQDEMPERMGPTLVARSSSTRPVHQ